MALTLKTLLNKLANIQTKYPSLTRKRNSTKTLGEETLEELLDLNVGFSTYTCILYQNNENTIYPSILGNNTLGDIVWSRTDTGIYNGTLEGAFPEYRTWFNYPGMTEDGYIINVKRIDDDNIQVRQFDGSSSASDGIIYLPLEIRVYEDYVLMD